MIKLGSLNFSNFGGNHRIEHLVALYFQFGQTTLI